ncbi:unnamed protein product [Paramecium sonneborni]|uniref:Uncharacterized protein n=1 Tax=Paramecium sonneborni TaxID=65129 RepID=A0A8S1RRQ7_9CILI|nr:unnamed protein product [Paramecium sonneborni]
MLELEIFNYLFKKMIIVLMETSIHLMDALLRFTIVLKIVQIVQEQGWQYYEKNKNCLPICDDSIITYFEESDDSNTYQYDGCYQYKYSCPLMYANLENVKNFNQVTNQNSDCVNIYVMVLKVRKIKKIEVVIIVLII